MKPINNLIKRKPEAFSFNTKLIEINTFIEGNGYSHFPVVDNDIYLGSISALDIQPSKTSTVEDFRYTLQPYFVRKDADWFEILEKFAQYDTNILAVLDDNNDYLGYYVQDDIYPFLTNTPFLKDAGLAIIIQKHFLDYSISEIAQIVESNNCKLLGVFVSSVENQLTQITVKASAGNINEIIQSFRRFGYEIISEHNQDSYLNELKERSAYLDKFLNI